LSADTLFGRETELAALTEFVAGTRGAGRTIVLHGDAGIGKSALVAATAELAEQRGLRVLSTTGVEAEQHLPYAGLHQLLHPFLGDLPGLPSGQRDALGAAMGHTDQEVTDVFLVGLATLNLLSEVAAGKPVLLIAEDAHWLDRASADVLAFVARRIDSEPILLLAAVRSGVRSAFDVGFPVLEIGPLAGGDAAALLDDRAPHLAPAARSRCLTAAAGNALALIELPNTAEAPHSAADPLRSHLALSARLEQAFTARMAGCPPATQTALLAAALNDGASVAETLDVCRAITGEPTDLAIFAPAVEAGLIDVEGGEVHFRHPLMRSAIPQAASHLERQAVHAALARIVPDGPDRQAWHRAAATLGPDETVAAELEGVAQRAQRLGSILAAITALERSARLTPDPPRRADRLLQAAELAVEAGRQEIVAELLGALPAADLTKRQRGRALWIRGSSDEGIRDDVSVVALADLAAETASDGDIDLALRILWSAGVCCTWTDPGTAARHRVVEVLESLPIDRADMRAVAVLAFAAPLDRGVELAERLQAVADRRHGDPVEDRLVGAAAAICGSFDLSARFFRAASQGLREQGRLGQRTRALAMQAYVLVRLADLNAAIPVVEEAARLAAETEQPNLYAAMCAQEAEIHALRGEVARAYALADEAESMTLSIGARPVLVNVQCARGIAALAEGKYDAALDHFKRMHDPSDPAYHWSVRCYAVAELAEAASRSGRLDEIRDLVAELEQIATTTPSPALHAGLAYARAVGASDDQAVDRFEAALRASASWPAVRARTHLAYGEWLRRHRRAADSREHLRNARATFDALGVIPWSDRARTELRAAGEVSPRRTPHARDQLTPHELHIAQLAASGLSNKEIGQRLYLSHRTVSTHLYKIFPKLGITSRAELMNVIVGVDEHDAPAGHDSA
jgi:DNA-binding CsgD family transcriptional regulator/tetratricopeptide (TPR) repeat protein